jgi:hypothetical protein
MTAHTLALASMAYLGDVRGLRERQELLLDEARGRGNLLAAVCLTCGPATIGWLAADDPDEAERRVAQALAPWKHDLQLPAYLQLVSTVQIALYRGDARRALSVLDEAWPRLLTSMTLYVQNFRVTLRHLRGRAALALLVSGEASRLERMRLVRLVRAETRRLAAEDVVWAPALAATLEGGLLSVTGKKEQATHRLAEAATVLQDLDMPLFAAAAAGSVAPMLEQGVKHPERLVAMLVPRS